MAAARASATLRCEGEGSRAAHAPGGKRAPSRLVHAENPDRPSRFRHGARSRFICQDTTTAAAAIKKAIEAIQWTTRRAIIPRLHLLARARGSIPGDTLARSCAVWQT